jgi:hypothetical protein
MSTGWSTLDQLLRSIPPGSNRESGFTRSKSDSNPSTAYAAVQEYLKGLLSSATIAGTANPRGFVVNIGIIIAIYSACFLAALFTLAVKYKHGSLWFLRRRGEFPLSRAVMR